MNVRLTGKNLDDIVPFLQRYGIAVTDSEEAGLIICHGGDGTLLLAEQAYPGVPKFPIRDEGTAPRCPDHHYDAQLAAFAAGQLATVRLPKIAGRCNGRCLKALNDISIHHGDITAALRYRVRIDGELYAHEIVGDGVCLSTVHGSTAYYRSITHGIFRVGLGLAFNNSTEEVDHLVLSEKSRIEIEIVRGPGLLTADNAPEIIKLESGDVVEMFQIDETAEVIGLADFMCPRCRALRHPHKLPFKGYF
ncbi:MAG: NAD(+)/NADH kinase [Lentisphaeria bacterium]|nr:NAD(+)/NADH kinase [Lentisphaeria bacterium]